MWFIYKGQIWLVQNLYWSPNPGIFLFIFVLFKLFTGKNYFLRSLQQMYLVIHSNKSFICTGGGLEINHLYLFFFFFFLVMSPSVQIYNEELLRKRTGWLIAFWNAIFHFPKWPIIDRTCSMWPDWTIYWTLANFSKPMATVHLPKSPTFLGNLCKGVKTFNFSSEIIFGQLL